MRIAIVTPVDVNSTRGNGVTARRWQALFQQLGHDAWVQADQGVTGQCDLLVALHARKSAAAVAAFQRSHPGRPIVLVMTGTDLYSDLPHDESALASVAAADRIVVLQPVGVASLPEEARAKAHVIYQSVAPRSIARVRGDGTFGVCVLAHMRSVKDPLLAARAASALPDASRIHVTLAGGATDEEWKHHAESEQSANPRFSWVGELAPEAARELLARSEILVVSSLLEGGANVIAEAIVTGIPVLASRVDGNVGMLGADYAGYFPVGDADALTALLSRSETDSAFLAELTQHVVARAPLFDPRRERAACAELLAIIEK